MRAASPTFTIQGYTGAYQAVASFQPGLFAARRPLVGPSAATPASALSALLAMPRLAIVLAAMVNPADAPDVD